MHFEDSLEKPKNPISRAIRRRGRKQVSFADPTYRDAPQYDFTSEEEEDDDQEVEGQVETNGDGVYAQNGHEQGQADDVDEITAVAPLNIKNSTNNAQQSSQSSSDQIEDDRRSAYDESVLNEDNERSKDENVFPKIWCIC
jgi:hypothetical protein